MTLLKTAKYLLIIFCLFLAVEAQANCAWSNSACLDFGSSWATSSSLTFCTAPAGGAINCCCGPESEKGCCEKIDKVSKNKTTKNLTRGECQNETYAQTTFFKDFTAKNNNCTKEAVYDNCVWKVGKTTTIGPDGISMVSETGGCNSIEISPGSNSPYNCVPGDRTDPNQVCCCSQIKSETTTSVPRDFIFPGLQIPFPNLRLTPTSSLISEVNSDGSYFLSVPWIAEYISGAYNYGVGIVGILAAVVLMAGGLMWLLSRGDASKTSTAKELIVGSVTGLIIIMTSSVLLDYINPELTKLRPIELGSIKAAEFLGDYSDSSISSAATALNPYAAGCHGDCQSIANKNIIPGDLVMPENKYLLEINKGDRNKVNKDTYEKYKKAIDCINKKDGKPGDFVKYKINNSWRPAQVQIDMKKPNNVYGVTPSDAASPCCSNHGSGVAIDISHVNNQDDIKCFKDNGLLRNKDVGGHEDWHFSPSGR